MLQHVSGHSLLPWLSLDGASPPLLSKFALTLAAKWQPQCKGSWLGPDQPAGAHCSRMLMTTWASGKDMGIVPSIWVYALMISCGLSREIHHDVICDIDLPVSWVMLSYRIWGDITCVRCISHMTSWPKSQETGKSILHMMSSLSYLISHVIPQLSWSPETICHITCDIMYDIIHIDMISYMMYWYHIYCDVICDMMYDIIVCVVIVSHVICDMTWYHYSICMISCYDITSMAIIGHGEYLPDHPFLIRQWAGLHSDLCSDLWYHRFELWYHTIVLCYHNMISYMISYMIS